MSLHVSKALNPCGTDLQSPLLYRMYINSFIEMNDTQRSQARKELFANWVEDSIMKTKYSNAFRRSTNAALDYSAHYKKVRAVELAFLDGQEELPEGTDETFVRDNANQFLPDVIAKFAPIQVQISAADMDEARNELAGLDDTSDSESSTDPTNGILCADSYISKYGANFFFVANLFADRKREWGGQ